MNREGRGDARGRRDARAALHDTIVEQLPDAVIVTDLSGRVTAWNPAAEALYGRPAEQALDRPIFELNVPEEGREDAESILREVMAEGAWSGEFPARHRDGTPFPAWTRLVLLHDEEGHPHGYLGISRDVREQTHARDTLRRRARQQEAVATLAGAALEHSDLDALFAQAVAVVTETLELTALEVLATSEDGGRLHRRAGSAAAREAEDRRMEVVAPGSPHAHALASGEPTWSSGDDPQLMLRIQGRGQPFGLLVASVRDADALDDDQVQFLSSVADLLSGAVRQRRLLDELAHRAQHDPLTDLPNRILFEDRLEHAIRRAQRTREQVAVLFVDLDRFKTINDALGHHAGDELLRAVARRLERTTRAQDTVARIGGDEFVLMLAAVEEPGQLSAVTQKLLHAFDAPFVVADRQIQVQATIGVCRYPDDGGDAETLLRNADVAMYEGKLAGRNTVHFFTPELSHAVKQRMQLETDLRQALVRDELRLVYQAQHDLASGEITGTEALLRWQHPQRGLLGPESFVAIAEEAGLMPAIGRWVLRTALHQQRAWRDAGVAGPRVAVNVSRRELAQADFVTLVRDALEAAELPPEQLELEVTEAAVLLDFEDAEAKLGELKAAGVGVTLDDFGVGYASLAHLLRLPLDRLKIDTSFVGRLGVGGPEDSEAFVRIMVSLARDLELDLVVEGVETDRQLVAVRQVGCLFGQGYLFDRPMPGSELHGAGEG